MGGARLRALLTVLALRPARTVQVGVLVDEVWAGDPPADATGALQALVGRLRRALGADAVISAEGGYRLAASPDDVDLHRFDRLAADGTRALADGDAAKAAALLDDALALWQGPALTDLPDPGAEAGRWETRRVEARRTRLAAAVELGQADTALPELTALCDARPLDEPLQALRLRALRDTGRTAEALAAYEEIRHLLADRLGSDPGVELRALHGELLQTTPAPAAAWAATPAAAAAATPAPVEPEVRTSYRAATEPPVPTTASAPDAHTGAVHLGAIHPEAVHPDAVPPTAPGNLRARLTSFVGRDADIEVIRDALTTARLVTLLGPGGAGKTRLSQEAAESLRDRTPHAVPDGVWLAELAPVEDPDTVPEAVLTAVGARETVLYGAGAEELRAVAERNGNPLARLAEHCARRRMLLILDNCEHVVDAAARLAQELLARCPHLTILATSREPLGIEGELLRPVESLPEPFALRLLADRGAAVRPGFRTDVADDNGETAAACAEICRRLDGLPLAIELAAARLRILTPRQIAARLDDRFRLLTTGSRTALPRQQTLRAVVDWSWELLDEGERDVLRRLSVFAGGCDLAAAEAVCGPAALDALASLVDKSLVVAAPWEGTGEGGMRYRLLETVAEYARERLDEAGDRATASRAHLTYYRELARTTDPLLRCSGQSTAMERLEREYENLRTALRHAVAERDEQEALSLVLSLAQYWQMRDQRSEARAWAREVTALGPDPFAEPVRKAAPVWERCTDTPPPLTGELLWEARRSVHMVHLACTDPADHADAWQSPKTRERLRTITGVYEPGMPQVCRFPGLVWCFTVLLTGQVNQVHAIMEQNIRTCRDTPGYEWDLAGCLQMRANILANRTDWAGDAAADADESLAIYQRLGDVWGSAEALSARGEARERRGEYELAGADYRQAIEYAEQLGARSQVAVLKSRLGSALIESGDEEEGERLLRKVIAETDGGIHDAMPAARMFLTAWLGVSGRTDEARVEMRHMREKFGATGFVVFDAFLLGQEAVLDVVAGEYAQGLDRIRRALPGAADTLTLAVMPHIRSIYLDAAALGLAQADGGRRATDAARCLGAAAAALPPRHHSARAEREIRGRAEAATRAALGDTAYEAAYAEGRGLSVEEATALV